MQPWWQEFAERLEWELEALRQVCTSTDILLQDDTEGILVISVVTSIEKRSLQLQIHFPSDYPYMRPMLYANDETFHWHQNPYGKNLCLLGTAGDHWSPGQNAASLIKEQLPKLISANASEDIDPASLIEEVQAEPFSVFLTYQPDSAMLLLSPLHPKGDAGTFRSMIRPFAGTLRGAIVESSFYEEGVEAADMPDALGYTSELSGRWVRSQRRPSTAQAQAFWQELVSEHPELRHHQWKRFQGRSIDLVAVVVSEEISWRTCGDTVLFVLLELKKKGTSKAVVEATFIQKYVADRASLAARIPEVGNLHERCVLLAGAGSLGSTCALDLARIGLGSLKLLDGDRTEAGNAVRWALGMEYAGMYKVHALQEHIRRNFPYTTVVPFPYALGTQAATLSIQRQVYKGIELILDATADRGVGFALAERARTLGIPYVWVSSTEGNWGGMVVNMRPGRTNACWWCLMKRLEEGSLPSPPAGPVMGVQVRGCASPTFSGAMFDSTELSLQAIRCVVGDLGTSYPQYPWDYMMLALRASNGDVIVPSWQTALLTPHPECPRFHEHLA